MSCGLAVINVHAARKCSHALALCWWKPLEAAGSVVRFASKGYETQHLQRNQSVLEAKEVFRTTQYAAVILPAGIANASESAIRTWNDALDRELPDRLPMPFVKSHGWTVVINLYRRLSSSDSEVWDLHMAGGHRFARKTLFRTLIASGALDCNNGMWSCGAKFMYLCERSFVANWWLELATAGLSVSVDEPEKPSNGGLALGECQYRCGTVRSKLGAVQVYTGPAIDCCTQTIRDYVAIEYGLNPVRRIGRTRLVSKIEAILGRFGQKVWQEKGTQLG